MNQEYPGGEMRSMMNRLKGPSGSIPTGSTQWDSSWPEFVKYDERHYLFSYLEGRFGIPESVFDDYLLFKRKKSWLILRDVPHIMNASQLKVLTLGLKAFRKVGSFLKPTTKMIQIFGHAATKAKIEIDEKQLTKLLDGEELQVDLDVDMGYVILVLKKSEVLGLGFYSNGKVRTQIPNKELKKALLQGNQNTAVRMKLDDT
jgi:NOL1/NOP2/fmu family ribosome biogenesis protein